MLMVRSRVTDIIARIYFIIVSLLLAAIFVGDTVLYGYWGFKLDATPLFYFASSPSAAMASVSTWQVIGGIILWLVVATLFYTAFHFTSLRIKVNPLSKKRKPWGVALGLFMTALLFIPTQFQPEPTSESCSRQPGILVALFAKPAEGFQQAVPLL